VPELERIVTSAIKRELGQQLAENRPEKVLLGESDTAPNLAAPVF